MHNMPHKLQQHCSFSAMLLLSAFVQWALKYGTTAVDDSLYQVYVRMVRLAKNNHLD